jgi:hypothetical protein
VHGSTVINITKRRDLNREDIEAIEKTHFFDSADSIPSALTILSSIRRDACLLLSRARRKLFFVVTTVGDHFSIPELGEATSTEGGFSTNSRQ